VVPKTLVALLARSVSGFAPVLRTDGDLAGLWTMRRQENNVRIRATNMFNRYACGFLEADSNLRASKLLVLSRLV
jgi:hypothetical protein